jgi:hypothetical protein
LTRLQSLRGSNLRTSPFTLNADADTPRRNRPQGVFFTAAINSDGTVASCFQCVPANTKRLWVGQYQIDLAENVRAVNGWSRWDGTVNAWRNTA